LLWDLRSPGGVVREYIGHQDRGVANVGGAFSPCLRFLAIGSEDQAAHVYDLRLPRAITKVRGCHKDAITDVSFHPRHPQLATAGLDGRIEFFRSQE
jgi:WD40 repeat protein